MSTESTGGTLQEKSAEADIPLRTYLRGYRANLRVRALAIGAACVLGGGIITVETAGQATADPAPARCQEATSPQAACEPLHDEQSGHQSAVVETILGTCLIGGGAMLCAIAGSPGSPVPSPEAGPTHTER